MEARSDAAAHAWQQAFVHAPGARVNWTADANGARRALDWGAGGPWHHREPLRVRSLARVLASLNGTHPFEIVTLGNSVTAGHGLGPKHTTDQELAWPARLERVMHSLGYPGVRVTNLANQRGGTSAHFLQNTWQQPLHLAALDRASLIIADYSVSDCESCCSFNARIDGLSGRELVDQATEWLARVVLSRRADPALVYLETFTAAECSGYTCSSGPITKWGHWPTISALKLPVISYFDAICPTPASASEWEPKPHTKSEPSHENIARIVASSLLLLAHSLRRPLSSYPDQPAEVRNLGKAGCEAAPTLKVTRYVNRTGAQAGGAAAEDYLIISATHVVANGSLVLRWRGGERAPSSGRSESHPAAARVDRLTAAVTGADVAALERLAQAAGEASGQTRAAGKAAVRWLEPSSGPDVVCTDTVGWRSTHNPEWTCDTFRTHFCQGGAIKTGEGPKFGSPEANCCGCGKGKFRIAPPPQPSPFQAELPSPTAASTALAARQGNISAWRAAVDRAGKVPGWLAPVGVPAWLTFEFELNQIVSQVAVEYLTTYQNIGSAYCRLDGGELVRLDGLVADSRTSHERTSTLSTTARGGRHQLSCISDGQKFKITRVVCTPSQMCDQEAAR